MPQHARMSQLLPTAGERFGTVVRVRRAGDFVIRLSHYRPDIRVAEHHHPLAYFSYVVSGSLAERARGSNGRFERGSQRGLAML